MKVASEIIIKRVNNEIDKIFSLSKYDYYTERARYHGIFDPFLVLLNPSLFIVLP